MRLPSLRCAFSSRHLIQMELLDPAPEILGLFQAPALAPVDYLDTYIVPVTLEVPIPIPIPTYPTSGTGRCHTDDTSLERHPKCSIHPSISPSRIDCITILEGGDCEDHTHAHIHTHTHIHIRNTYTPKSRSSLRPGNCSIPACLLTYTNAFDYDRSV